MTVCPDWLSRWRSSFLARLDPLTSKTWRAPTMPGRYFDYFANVAERMLPFLAGRRVAIEQRFPDSSQVVYRRHAGSHGRDNWIQIKDAEDVRKWARQYAEGFHANIRS